MENSFLSPEEIVDSVISSGSKKGNLVCSKTMLLSILAGCFIALGAFGAAMVSFSITNISASKFASALVFPVGLMLVVICGAELFTGNNIMMASFMEKKISFSQLAKNWIIVYLGNFVGSIIIVILIFYTGLLSTGGGALGAVAIKTAYAKVNLSFAQAFTRGILCNVLVVLSVWMVMASKDIVSKIFSCWFPVMLFVLSGYEHCIANMYFIPIGILSKYNGDFLNMSGLSFDKLQSLNLQGFFINNLIPVTLGNIIGGAFAISFIYWVIHKRICICEDVNITK